MDGDARFDTTEECFVDDNEDDNDDGNRSNDIGILLLFIDIIVAILYLELWSVMNQSPRESKGNIQANATTARSIEDVSVVVPFAIVSKIFLKDLELKMSHSHHMSHVTFPSTVLIILAVAFAYSISHDC